MNNTPVYGHVYHTKDGRTVYFDPITKQVSVFDEILTLDKLIGSASGPAGSLSSVHSQQYVDEVLQKMFPIGSLGFDLMLALETKYLPEPEEDDLLPILGTDIIDYFILVTCKGIPLSISSRKVSHWVSEYKGHMTDYPDYEKHKILPDQFSWLNTHKDCSVMAWYDQECPAFVALACQDHARIIQPIRVIADENVDPEASQVVETGIIETTLDSVFTDERGI
jgi:hypothetical protein